MWLRYLQTMFNLGFSEVIAIAVIALLVIGPKQLPEVAKVVGRLLGELRKATQDLSGGLLEVKRDVENSIHDVRSDLAKETRKFQETIMNIEEDMKSTAPQSDTENKPQESLEDTSQEKLDDK